MYKYHKHHRLVTALHTIPLYLCLWRPYLYLSHSLNVLHNFSDKPKNCSFIDVSYSSWLQHSLFRNLVFSNEMYSIDYNAFLYGCFKIQHPNLICIQNWHTLFQVQTVLNIIAAVVNIFPLHFISIPLSGIDSLPSPLKPDQYAMYVKLTAFRM